MSDLSAAHGDEMVINMLPLPSKEMGNFRFTQQTDIIWYMRWPSHYYSQPFRVYHLVYLFTHLTTDITYYLYTGFFFNSLLPYAL